MIACSKYIHKKSKNDHDPHNEMASSAEILILASDITPLAVCSNVGEDDHGKNRTQLVYVRRQRWTRRTRRVIG